MIADSPSAPRIEGWLLGLDRRRRLLRALGLTATGALAAALPVYLLRWISIGGLGDLSPAVLFGALVLLTLGAWAALTATTERSPEGAARTVDSARDLEDLVTTAWHLERAEARGRTTTASGDDRALRESIHDLVRRRAADELDGLAPPEVVPWSVPRQVWPALAALALASFLPLPPMPTGGGQRSDAVLVDDERAAADDEQGDDDDQVGEEPTREQESDAFPEETVTPVELRAIAELDPRLAQLLQGERAELSAEDLAALAETEGLSADALARLEELAERLDPNEPLEPFDGEPGQPADPTGLGEESAGGFEELGRERSDNPTPMDRPNGEQQPPGAGAQAGQGGEQQAGEAGSEAPGGADEAAAQAIELPPTPTGEEMQAADAAAAANAMGQAAMAAGDQAGEQAGEQQPGAGGGDATGPQAGESELFGDEALVNEAVTLELTLLKAREEDEERPQRPERRWRASKSEDSTVRMQRARPGDWSTPDRESTTERVPRHHRALLREYFTPPPRTSATRTEPKQENPPGRP